ncbi:MAG: TraB/GumN family protein [Chitinophagaceae bacterium]|nr:TraB/GumN family protein [Chitinophagaceae bacterium]
MKKITAIFLLAMISLASAAQKKNNSLLWKISGNGLEKPSYLFGTMHMLCKEDAYLSENMMKAIRDADRVYLELDMDNLFEMIGMMSKMKMKNDTTLKDLLTVEEYELTKAFFEKKKSMLPFSVLETYKPMVASSLLMESSMVCDQQVAMETLIMEEAKKNGKRIDGLETMAYQMSVFDSIPYGLQAKELYKAIAGEEKSQEEGEKLMTEMMTAYREQDLEKLSALIASSDNDMRGFEDLLLYNRNRNWVAKLKTLLHEKALVVAVGAGHLPGEQGVIELLRKEGYKVTPVQNKRDEAREL